MRGMRIASAAEAVAGCLLAWRPHHLPRRLTVRFPLPETGWAGWPSRRPARPRKTPPSRPDSSPRAAGSDRWSAFWRSGRARCTGRTVQDARACSRGGYALARGHGGAGAGEGPGRGDR
eukprot:363984-Chlamydomonas_euryale.AAC.28